MNSHAGDCINSHTGILVTTSTSIQPYRQLRHQSNREEQSLMVTAGVSGIAEGISALVLPSLQDSSLALTQDGALQQTLVQLAHALIQSAPAAAAQHAAAMLMMMLQIRSGMLLAAALPASQLLEVLQ